MKRGSLYSILSIICTVAILLFASIPTVAETFDLSNMSDPEILALLEQVNQEIVSRGIQKTAKLAKGAYIAGRDIPAGSYIYTCLATGTDWGNVTVYSDGGSGD